MMIDLKNRKASNENYKAYDVPAPLVNNYSMIPAMWKTQN